MPERKGKLALMGLPTADCILKRLISLTKAIHMRRPGLSLTAVHLPSGSLSKAKISPSGESLKPASRISSLPAPPARTIGRKKGLVSAPATSRSLPLKAALLHFSCLCLRVHSMKRLDWPELGLHRVLQGVVQHLRPRTISLFTPFALRNGSQPLAAFSFCSCSTKAVTSSARFKNQ